MIRKLLYCLLAMLAALAGFEAHRRMAGQGPAGRAARPVDHLEPIADGPTMPIGGTGIGPSYGVRLFAVDGVAVRTVTADEFVPLSARRATLRNVVFRTVNADGTSAWTIADRADVVVRRTDSPTPEFEEGRLTGNVEIRRDPLSDTDPELVAAGVRRPRHTERDVLGLTEADDLVIRCDELLFREGGQRIEIPDRVSVLSPEMFLAGQTLNLEWTDIGRDLQYARLERGDKLIAYADAPPTTRRPAAARPDSGKHSVGAPPRAAGKTTRPADKDAGGPGREKAAPVAKAPDVRAYRFRFHKDVAADVPSEKLSVIATGPTAVLVLDWQAGRPGAEAAPPQAEAAGPGKSGRSPATAKAPPATAKGAATGKGRAEGKPSPPATVVWGGPLEVESIAPPSARPPMPPQAKPATGVGAATPAGARAPTPARPSRRSLLPASGAGDRVVITYDRSTIQCTRFRVDPQGRCGVFETTAGGVVRLTNADGSFVEGTMLTVDPPDEFGRQRAVVAGPGGFRTRIDDASELRGPPEPTAATRPAGKPAPLPTAPRPANPFAPDRTQPLVGRFGDRLEADYVVASVLLPAMRPLADGGQSPVFVRGLPILRRVERNVPERIALFGGASLSTVEWAAEAERGLIAMIDPAEWPRLSRPVPGRVELHEGVRVRRADEELTAWHVVIPAAAGPDGRAVFTRIEATEQVRVRRADRELWADRRLSVELTRPVAGPGRRERYAAGWTVAEGNVHLRDVRAGVEAFAERLHSADEDSAVLFASAGRPARVVRNTGEGRTELIGPDRIEFRRAPAERIDKTGGPADKAGAKAAAARSAVDVIEADVPGPGVLIAPVGGSFAPDGPAVAGPGGVPGTMRMTWSKGATYREDPAKLIGRAEADGDIDIVVDRRDPDGAVHRERAVAAKATVHTALRPPSAAPVPIPEVVPAVGPGAPAAKDARGGAVGKGKTGAPTPAGPKAEVDRPARDTAARPGPADGPDRRATALVLERDVHVVGVERALGGDRRTFALAAPGLIRYDLDRQTLSIPGSGELADEQVAVGVGGLDEWVAADVDFARGRHGRRRTPAGLSWKESMHWERAAGRIDLAGDVRLVNSGGGLSGGRPGSPAAAFGPTPGRGEAPAVLDCRRLTVLLDQAPADPRAPSASEAAFDPARGMGRLRRFDAAGDVHYREGRQTVRAERAVYERRPAPDGVIEMLELHGAPGRPAESIEADPDRQIYRPIRADRLRGVRTGSGAFQFRVEGAAGEPTGNR